MQARALRRLLVLALLASIGAVGACSLNPQPIPPGLTSNAGAEADASFANEPSTDGHGDAGSGAFGDGATRVEDASVDAAPPVPFTDGSFDGDGESDAAVDADATTD